jgi:glyoxylase-like metal-dependent hydrolase (beta-lactamase superfamily II)
VATELEAPAYLHPDDAMLWDRVHSALPGGDLTDGQTFRVGDVHVVVRQTPGHSPGACCFHVPALWLVFTVDALFQGGPGATGRSFSDFGTIVASIRDRLLSLPPATVVLPGHRADDGRRRGAARPGVGRPGPLIPHWTGSRGLRTRHPSVR